jgi:long-chain acyl-CoA synthetase
MRVKELGRWREITWAEYTSRVASVGRALLHLGVQRGDRVAIVSDNRPEWLITDLAVQGLGAATVGLFVTSPAAELAAMARRAGVAVAIVEDEEQFDKLSEVQDQVSLRHLIVIDPRGIQRLEAPASSFEALEALGGPEAVAIRDGDLRAWEAQVATLADDEAATIVFTPGTTGEPKAALLTNANLVAAGAAGAAATGLGPQDELVSTLPLVEMAERVLTEAQAVRVGATVNFGEGGDALDHDFREVQPTIVLGTPRLWERLQDTAEAGLRVAGRIKRSAARMARTAHSGPVADALVSRPLRRRLGLGRTRAAICATAACPSDLVGWWASIGVPLREAYGLIEAAGVATLAAPGATGSGSVGHAMPGVEVRTTGDVGAEGEVLVRGPVVFAGYLDERGDSRAERDADGWLHTGDIGVLDATGDLTIVGRAQDRITTSTGHRVAPRVVEARLEVSPYVRTAIVVGNGRPHLGALLDIDAGAVGDWAADNGVPYTTDRTLVERPEVRELLSGVIAEANSGVDEADRVLCFALLPQPLDVEDGTLTPTFKVRRAATAERFKDLVEQMYAGGAEQPT